MIGQRIVIIGGRGFVGSHIVRALALTGARPVLFGPAMQEDRLADLAGQFDEVEGSITSRTQLHDAFEASAAEALVCCAAYGSGRLGLMRSGEAEADGAMDVNVLGFGKLLDAAREAGVRRVFWTSSTVVYGPSSDYPVQPVDEDASVGPMTRYGLTKVLAEELARYHRRRHGLAVVGLRLPLILGPGLWYDGAAAGLSSLFQAARSRVPYRLEFHDEMADLMHVTDVASAVMMLLRHRGSLATAYNLEGFRARASDIVRLVRARRPAARIELAPTPPALLSPLISGARLRADTGFAAAYALPAFVDAMLEDPTP